VQELKKELPNGRNLLWWKLKPHENEVKLLRWKRIMPLALPITGYCPRA